MGKFALIVCLLWTAFAAGLPPATAHAQGADDEARALFQAGRVAYERGRFQQALEQFEEAYKLSDRPLLLFNIANSLDKLRRDEEALAAFEKYVDLVDDSPQHEVAYARIEFLRQQVEENKDQARVASPAEAAASVESGDDAAAGNSATADSQSGQPIYKKWWLWTAVGVVVVGVAAGVAVAASGGGATTTAPPVLLNDMTVTRGL